MATKVIVSKEKLDNLANAINTKAETSGAKTLDELILEVDNFQGGIDTTDATATSGDILLGKTAYVNEVKVEGTIETYDGSSEGGMLDDTVDRIIDGTLTELKSNVTSVKNYIFYYNKNLVNVNFPNATSIGDYAFGGCFNLTSINAPNVTSLGNSVFYNCLVLEYIKLDNATSIPQKCFYNNEKLLVAIFPKASSIGIDGFYECGVLTDLYLGYEGIVTLASSTAFNYVKGKTKIHVRAEYADQYASATNWSSLLNGTRFTIVGDYNE